MTCDTQKQLQVS